MKESKFIELLNLYVDREISREDAAALEAEIARSPERLRVYQQYCRMSRASALLFEQFHAQSVPAPAGKLVEAARQVDDKIVAFPSASVAARSHASNWYVAAGFAAVAACVGFVLLRPTSRVGAVVESKPVQSSPAVVAVSQPAVPAELATAPAAAPVAPATREADFQPVFAVFMKDATAATSAPVTLANDATNLDWMQQVKLTPLRLTPVPAANASREAESPASLQIQRTPQGEVEMTAFQFQR